MEVFKLKISARILLLLLFLSFYLTLVQGRRVRTEIVNKYSLEESDLNSTKWAMLVAGSNGYSNYRHQADVCHAYHVLRNKGLKDENIVVFMYDDIAYDYRNPRQGVIINRPNGENVYADVPHDYVGENVSARNFYAVLLGNNTGITGGSGKVLKSGPDDQIFIYFSGHGDNGVLAMPGDYGSPIIAAELTKALLIKEASNTFDTMLIYVEACVSGSMFMNFPTNLSIYVTTAANPYENSYATHCFKEVDGQTTCLADLYSLSWLEDSEQNDPIQETLGQQYAKVQKRTTTSHVMKYGNLDLDSEFLALYFVPDFELSRHKQQNHSYTLKQSDEPSNTTVDAIKQEDASTLYFIQAVIAAPKGSPEQEQALKELVEEESRRAHIYCIICEIGKVIFDTDDYYDKIMAVRSPAVDDWDCYKTMIATFQTHCGALSTYGTKYIRAFANIYVQCRFSSTSSVSSCISSVWRCRKDYSSVQREVDI